MAANEHPDPQLYQRTRDTLGKVIKKPPLNDKLLSRPPFKYLRDIILEVIKHFSHFNSCVAPRLPIIFYSVAALCSRSTELLTYLKDCTQGKS